MSLNEVRWIDLPSHGDDRGVLTQIEALRDIPIEIKRVFYMHHIISERGGHAHQETDQVAVAVYGRLKIEIADPQKSVVYDLTDPTKGLYFPRLLFTKLYDFSEGAVCMVLANTIYDRSKSFRTWEEYLAFMKKAGRT